MKTILQFIEEAALTVGQIDKRPGRWDKFKEKVFANEPFQLTKGPQVVLGYHDPERSAAFLDELKGAKTAKEFNALYKRLPVKHEKAEETIPWGMLKKTPEFGGLTRSTTQVEDREVGLLNKAAQGIMEDLGGPMTLVIPKGKTKRLIPDVVGFRQTKQVGRYAPKSDFEAVDSKGKAVAFFSHKAGSSPEHFQQWGGVSDFTNDKEVQDFIKTIVKLFGDTIPPRTTVGRKIKGAKLAGQAVFGKDYPGKPGIENVDALYQGTMDLVETNGGHMLTTATHVHYNGDRMPKGYTPILVGRPVSDRGVKGTDLKRGRIIIYPEAGRKINQWI